MNILYYKFIEKSQIFFSENTFFFTFCDTGNPKMQKNAQSLGPSFSSSSQLSNFMFFLQDQFL